MKKLILLTLFVSSNIYASRTWIPQLKQLKDIRANMQICKEGSTNPALMIREIVKSRDVSRRDCLINAEPQVEEKRQARKAARVKRGDTLALIKNYDCSTLNGFIKLLCESKQ